MFQNACYTMISGALALLIFSPTAQAKGMPTVDCRVRTSRVSLEHKMLGTKNTDLPYEVVLTSNGAVWTTGEKLFILDKELAMKVVVTHFGPSVMSYNGTKVGAVLNIEAFLIRTHPDGTVDSVLTHRESNAEASKLAVSFENPEFITKVSKLGSILFTGSKAFGPYSSDYMRKLMSNAVTNGTVRDGDLFSAEVSCFINYPLPE